MTFIAVKIYVAISENSINRARKNAAFYRYLFYRLFARKHRNVSETSHARVCWTMPRIPGDRLCSVFCEQIGERHVGTQTRRQERLENGRGGSSISRCWKGRERGEGKEEKNEKKKQQQRGWKHCYVFLVPFSVQVPPPLVFFSFPFFSLLPQISYRCAMRYPLPNPSQTHRLVLRCAPLLSALHIAYHDLAFCPPYYVFGHYK